MKVRNSILALFHIFVSFLLCESSWAESAVITSSLDVTFVYDSLQKDPFVWFDNEYKEPGIYKDTLIGGGSHGEDSIGWLLLRVIYEDSLRVCDDEQVTFHTPWGDFDSQPDCECLTGYLLHTYDGEWLVNATLCVIRAACDCDTTYSITDTTLVYDTLQAHPFRWFNKEYSQPGVYSDTLVEGNYEGCDSIGRLLLRVIYADSLYACGDEQVTFHTPWGDFVSNDTCECLTGYPIATDDNEWLVNASLCVVRLETDTIREDTTLCYGASIDWHGITIDHTAEYEYHEPFLRLPSCDSIVYYLNATIKDEPTNHPTTISVCAGISYTWVTYHDSIITAPGIYYDTLWTEHGCYSDTYILTLTHKACECDTAYSITYKEIQETELPTFQWNGIPMTVMPQNAQRDTTLVFPTIKMDASCDSIATLRLHVLVPCEMPSTPYPTYWREPQSMHY